MGEEIKEVKETYVDDSLRTLNRLDGTRENQRKSWKGVSFRWQGGCYNG